MATLSHPKLEGFDIIQVTYKQVGDHSIRTDILVPQTPYTGKRPIIAHFHGGGLVMGDSLHMGFWSHWLSDLALKYGAVIISPNYRLMPESTSVEIYDDIEDFWTWLHSPVLSEILATHTMPTQLDHTRILTAGESAGGLLSIALGLSHPDEIRAVTAAYPMVDTVSPGFTSPRANPPFGHSLPESIISDMLAATSSTSPESSTTSIDRLQFMLAAIEHGRLHELYQRGSDDSSRIHPMKRLEEPDVSVPRGGIAIIQGNQDSVVPVAGVEAFVARAREVTQGLPGSEKVVLTVREGEHGFDGNSRYEEKWVQDAIKTAVETWLE